MWKEITRIAIRNRGAGRPYTVFTVLAAALLAKSEIPNLDFLSGKPIVSTWVRVDGPAIVDETVGSVRIYTIRADWEPFLKHVRSQFDPRLNDFEVVPGKRGFLYPLCGADIRFCWRNGATIAFFKDFRGKPFAFKNPLADVSNIPGNKSKGWVTAIVFDGGIQTKAEYRDR